MRGAKRKKAPAFAPVKRPSTPPAVVSYCQHDTNDHIRRPELVARAEATQPGSGRVVTVEIHKQKRCGFLVSGEGKAVDGFFGSLDEARLAVHGFAQALFYTSVIWLTTFAFLATIFP